MKIKFDENMPCDRVESLRRLHDVDTVRDEGLEGSEDKVVWEATQREQRFFVTQDLDFSDLRTYLPGSHHGILLVRLHYPSRNRINARVEEILASPEVESYIGCFVVVTDSKVRIRQP